MSLPLPLPRVAYQYPEWTAHLKHGFFAKKSLKGETDWNINKAFPKALENRRQIAQSMSGPECAFFFPFQVHGTAVQEIQAPDQDLTDPCDGLITNISGVVLGVQTADCAPVIFWAPKENWVGICHAGWKGALAGILQKMVRCLENKGVTELQALIGPTIRPVHYPVGQDVYEIFLNQAPSNKAFFLMKDAEIFFDLPGYIKKVLQNQKIQVWDSQQDTFGDVYYSRRWALKYDPEKASHIGFCSAVACPKGN
jgi:YfiH family protein